MDMTILLLGCAVVGGLWFLGRFNQWHTFIGLVVVAALAISSNILSPAVVGPLIVVAIIVCAAVTFLLNRKA